MTLLDTMASLRSTRHFLSQPVEDHHLRQIIDAARWTGSARNRQPWRFIAVADENTRHRLAERGTYARHLATAPLVLVILSEQNGRLDTEFDVGRISQTISLAAHALGLGSCLATFHPEPNIAAVAELIDAPSGWTPRHAMSIGHPTNSTRQGRSAIPTGRLSASQLLIRHIA